MTRFSFKPACNLETFEKTFGQVLGTDEAAALLKIHPKALQKCCVAGRLQGVQIGKLWRFRACLLNASLADKTTQLAATRFHSS